MNRRRQSRNYPIRPINHVSIRRLLRCAVVGGLFCFFPRRTEQLTGDDYIAIGKALNNINKLK